MRDSRYTNKLKAVPSWMLGAEQRVRSAFSQKTILPPIRECFRVALACSPNRLSVPELLTGSRQLASTECQMKRTAGRKYKKPMFHHASLAKTCSRQTAKPRHSRPREKMCATVG